MADTEPNGNGLKPMPDKSTHVVGSSHGGATDGLPVAVSHHVENSRSVPHANGNGVSSRNGKGNGNGNAPDGVERSDGQESRANWTTLKLPLQPEPDVELPNPRGEGTVALMTVLESLLFVAGEPVEVAQLARSLNVPPEVVEEGLGRLAQQYKSRLTGLRLQVYNNQYQLVTAPAAAPFVEDFLNIDTSTKLSSAALETLAIVAYRQPVTRVQIESIRGVDSSGVLRSLVMRGLIEEIGRLDAVGRPILYGVTELFMQHFGLAELGELPPLNSEDAEMLLEAAEPSEDVSANNGRSPEDSL